MGTPPLYSTEPGNLDAGNNAWDDSDEDVDQVNDDESNPGVRHFLTTAVSVFAFVVPGVRPDLHEQDHAQSMTCSVKDRAHNSVRKLPKK